jgi:hypothetical protein
VGTIKLLVQRFGEVGEELARHLLRARMRDQGTASSSGPMGTPKRNSLYRDAVLATQSRIQCPICGGGSSERAAIFVRSTTGAITMPTFHILGLPDDLTREVRETRRSPGYGHPALREVAGGTGPCRACLEPFRVGEEERVLFTYRPPSRDGTLGAPGPVFIHAERCPQYRGAEFPTALRSMPLMVEAWGTANRILAAREATGGEVDSVFAELLANPAVDHLAIRHGEAGCHITRVERGPLPGDEGGTAG